MKMKHWLIKLNDHLDDWSSRHLPKWMYDLVSLQFMRDMSPEEKQASRRTSTVLIVIAFVLLVLSIIFDW